MGLGVKGGGSQVPKMLQRKVGKEVEEFEQEKERSFGRRALERCQDLRKIFHGGSEEVASSNSSLSAPAYRMQDPAKEKACKRNRKKFSEILLKGRGKSDLRATSGFCVP